MGRLSLGKRAEIETCCARITRSTRDSWLEAQMRWLTVLGFVLVSASGHAQINPQALTLAGLSDCITEAIATGSIDDSGPVIIYSCSDSKAKTLYNFLGRKVRAEIVQDRNGKFENRHFGNNACYHRVEDPGGKAADDFRCDLILAIGDILNE
jgi:hypothetical protein